jgi:hypothetical protein
MSNWSGFGTAVEKICNSLSQSTFPEKVHYGTAMGITGRTYMTEVMYMSVECIYFNIEMNEQQSITNAQFQNT